jgi:hypothetical protein
LNLKFKMMKGGFNAKQDLQRKSLPSKAKQASAKSKKSGYCSGGGGYSKTIKHAGTINLIQESSPEDIAKQFKTSQSSESSYGAYS